MRQLDLSLVFEQEPPKLDFVICGLAAGTVGNIASPGATGKSFAAIEMAMGVACAEADDRLLRLANGREGKVAIFNAEDPETVINQRLHSIGRHLNASSRHQVLANIEIYSLLGDQHNITCPQFVADVIKKCQNMRLIIFDTFTRFHQLNENDNGQMSQVVSCYEKIATDTAAAVLFLHHNSKGSVLSGQQSAQQSTRGASAITDNCRWQGYLQAMSPEEEREYGLEEWARKRFVKFGGNKENYGVATPEKWLERGEGGVLLNSSLGTSSKAKLKVVSKEGDWR